MGSQFKPVFKSPLIYWAILFNMIGIFTWWCGPLTFCNLLLVVYLLFKLSRGAIPAFRQRPLFPLFPSADAQAPERKLKRALVVVVAWTTVGLLASVLVPAGENWLMDIAANTYLAAKSLVQGMNPYAHMAQSWYTIDASTPHVEMVGEQLYMYGVPYYYGFPYFPVMALSYTPFILLIDGYDAIRWANLVLLLANIYALRILVAKQGSPSERRPQMMAVVAYLGIFVYGFEIFWHGIVDILLSTLLLFCFVLLQRRQFLLAGIFLGLAQAAKLLPPPLVALCIMLFLLGRDGFWKFSLAYVASSVVVILPFVLLDPEAFLSATILFYLTNHSVGDSTALWYFLPEWLQPSFIWLGYVLTLAAIPVFVRRKGGDITDVMAGAFACYLVFMAFSKMTHLNYLWSVYPLGCAALVRLIARLQSTPGDRPTAGASR